MFVPKIGDTRAAGANAHDLTHRKNPSPGHLDVPEILHLKTPAPRNPSATNNNYYGIKSLPPGIRLANNGPHSFPEIFPPRQNNSNHIDF
jgi:hypothetical protein